MAEPPTSRDFAGSARGPAEAARRPAWPPIPGPVRGNFGLTAQGAAKGSFDVGAVAAAERQAGVVVEDDGELAVEHRLELADALQVDQGRAVDADEGHGIELRLERGQGLAHQVVAAGGAYARVVALGGDVGDVGG